MQGMSFGPADLSASHRMKTTRVGGGHPGYQVVADPDRNDSSTARVWAQQDLWHYSIARMVDARTANGLLPFYGPFGDISDAVGCEAQFRAAFLMGCVGAWSLHPSQIDIARKVYSPDQARVGTRYDRDHTRIGRTSDAAAPRCCSEAKGPCQRSRACLAEPRTGAIRLGLVSCFATRASGRMTQATTFHPDSEAWSHSPVLDFAWQREGGRTVDRVRLRDRGGFIVKLRKRMLVVVAIAALGWLGAARDAAAQCQDTCEEGAQICRAAASTAAKECKVGCVEAVEAAARGAVAGCRENGFTVAECKPLVREAVAGARANCSQECRTHLTAAKAVCAGGVAQCRSACSGLGDPVCLQGCSTSFGTCTQSLKACAVACLAEAKADAAACRASSTADTIRGCLKTVAEEAVACGMGCYTQYPCDQSGAACVASCTAPGTP